MTAATRSHRQIVVTPLFLLCILKKSLKNSLKAILWPIFTVTWMQNLNPKEKIFLRICGLYHFFGPKMACPAMAGLSFLKQP